MKNAIPYSQRTFRGKFKYSMLFFVILLTVTLVLWVVTFRGFHFRNIAKNNKIVEAPLISYEVMHSTNTQPFTFEISYHYKYEDENGIVYEGHVGATTQDLDIADKAIENGQIVRIYIDGNGNSFPASTDLSQTKDITILIFSIILTIGTVVFFIIFLIPIKSKSEQ